MSAKYVVVSGSYTNDTGHGYFIQAIGTYEDARTAYGVAILQLNDFVDKDSGEMITPIFSLEGNTGCGMEVKHEKHTDFCYVLFGGPDGWGDKEEESSNAED